MYMSLLLHPFIVQVTETINLRQPLKPHAEVVVHTIGTIPQNPYSWKIPDGLMMVRT